ncbi:hypothetical protein C464_08810 [Halorubrum coriense DSM 10284]|uniref:DUF7999 domain-containing protein n=1 Tax=Halorubrum coriense DSM 10284 TaxID=1227466 RepID=M0EJN6_9EURY|nr:hypothetical protein [Halorubrum coriense]ELZ47288.1 hypothetical protein C464_08810 [Halorubrum coriense DSM 10284]
MGANSDVRLRCRVAAEPHGGRAVTLRGPDGRTYHAIDAAEAARERVAELRAGDTVEVALEPVRCRGDGWRVTRVFAREESDERPAAAAHGDRSASARPPR